MDRVFAAPIEAIGDHLIPPDVLTAQAFGSGQGVQTPRRHYLCERPDPDDFRPRHLHTQHVEPGSRGGHDLFVLLMIQRRKQQKTVVFQAENARFLGDAALAQDQNLNPALERIDHHRPFLEGHLHPGSVGHCRQPGKNGRPGCRPRSRVDRPGSAA